MSWSIKLIGKRESVKKAIEANLTLPVLVKSVIIHTLHDQVPEHNKSFTGVRVEGYGHHNENDDSSIGTSIGTIGKLEVEPLQLVE